MDNTTLDDARRRFLRAAALSVGGFGLSGCGGGGTEPVSNDPDDSPGPPAGTSSLAFAASGLTTGQWGTWTISNSFNPDPEGSGDTIFSYAQRAIWDPTNKVIQFWGGFHGSGGANTMRLATYNDASNSWSSPVPAGGNASFEHGYYNATVNQTTGAVYTELAFGDKTIRVFDQSVREFTSSFQPPSVRVNYSNPMEWHPNLNGGALLWGGLAGIYRRSGSDWVRLNGDGAMGDQGPVCTYNHKDGCVYMGGGNGAGSGSLWKVAADGSVTSRSYPSGWTLATWDANSTSNTAMLLGSSPTARMVAISKGRSIREYDDVVDSWSDVVETVPSTVDSGPVHGGNWIACSVPDYNCIVFFKLASMTSVSTTAHIWKR